MDLIEATKRNDLALMRQVVADGGDPNVRDERGRTALFHALPDCVGFTFAEDAERLVRLLLELGVDPSATDRRGLTVERWAAGAVTASIEAADFARFRRVLRGEE